MKFQILRIVVWPRNRSFAPQIIRFEPGKVNVITGQSRSGKSAIIPIIDYCLAATECQIPIDTIRDHSEWFGILFETENEQILLARKGPHGRDASDDFYVERGIELSVPPFIDTPNQKTENVKHLLNIIASTPYFRLSGVDDIRGYQERLSFRDLMALVFQSQEVVANQNILFYKTHAHEHRERLKNWLPYILGAESGEILAARQRLAAVQLKLNQLRKEIEKAKKISAAWLSNMHGHMQVAKQYGLLDPSYEAPADPTALIDTAQSILDNGSASQAPSLEHFTVANDEAAALEKEETALDDEISGLRKRMEDVSRLRQNLVGYGATARKRADRLQISEWLEDLGKATHDCPLCGNSNNEKTHGELIKIAAAFRIEEVAASKTKEVPASFAREEQLIRTKLEESLSKKRNITSRLDQLFAKDKETKEHFHRRQSLYFFFGHFKASLDTFRSLNEGGIYGDEIVQLEKEERELLAIVDPGRVRELIFVATTKISTLLLKHFDTLDVEDKYRRAAPQFSIKDLSLKVLSNDGHWHFLAEVGSASNWLSFHIAFICALHEYFNTLPHSCVPSFSVFDQPSQVYFPKTRKISASEDNSQYDDEDVQAVIGIFKTLAESAKQQKGKWQCIVLDHARHEIYEDIPGVHEVVEWRDGKKLIPSEWYAVNQS